MTLLIETENAVMLSCSTDKILCKTANETAFQNLKAKNLSTFSHKVRNKNKLQEKNYLKYILLLCLGSTEMNGLWEIIIKHVHIINIARRCHSHSGSTKTRYAHTIK